MVPLALKVVALEMPKRGEGSGFLLEGAMEQPNQHSIWYKEPKYIVVCKDDDKIVVATHRLFDDRAAAHQYASTLHADRCAIVVEVYKSLYEEAKA